MTVPKRISYRINLLRFPLMVMVVFWHAYPSSIKTSYAVLNTGINGKLSIIPDFISLVWVRSSIPLFFMISGYLFFHDYDGTFRTFLRKLKKRIYTLFFPFLFWNGLVLLLFSFARTWPITAKYFAHSFVPDNIFSAINALFGITRQPIAYQFWFIRDLCILVLIAPLIHAFLKQWQWKILIALFILLLFVGINKAFKPRLDALIAFSLGGYFAWANIDITYLDYRYKEIMICYVFSLSMDLWTLYTFPNTLMHQILHIFDAWVGMIFLFIFIGKIKQSTMLSKVLIGLGSGSFFLFATHEPLLSFLEKIFYLLRPPLSDVVILLYYFVIPILDIAICYVVYWILKKQTPSFLAVITGSRF